MKPRSSLFTSIILSAICYLAVLSVGDAFPIVNSGLRATRSTWSVRAGTEAKESFLIPRSQITPGSSSETNNPRVKSGAGIKKLSKTRHQRNESSLSDVIPKDPNGFFHPASLNRFKSSVASFKAWQRLNFLPDAATLARTKAQDVASELDFFIDKIATHHQPHRWQGEPNVADLQS